MCGGQDARPQFTDTKNLTLIAVNDVLHVALELAFPQSNAVPQDVTSTMDSNIIASEHPARPLTVQGEAETIRALLYCTGLL
jgi:hypothetical protein